MALTISFPYAEIKGDLELQWRAFITNEGRKIICSDYISNLELIDGRVVVTRGKNRKETIHTFETAFTEDEVALVWAHIQEVYWGPEHRIPWEILVRDVLQASKDSIQKEQDDRKEREAMIQEIAERAAEIVLERLEGSNK